MRFTKMHGAGNDYVYVSLFDETVPDPETLCRRISDRHKGIGSDGLILVAPSQVGDARMIMYNADGARGPMCGNGIRCVAKYVYDRGIARKQVLRIETDAGIREIRVDVVDDKVASATVDMGRPDFTRAAIPMQGPPGKAWAERIPVLDDVLVVYPVSMGNTHCVVFVDDPKTFAVERYGPALERHEVFPRRANVEFVAVTAPNRIVQRTWERGTGETLACGSGATAATVVAVERGLAESPVTVELTGGRLQITYEPGGTTTMTGEAVEVFTGTWPE
jgi:diaminopimelate epimerase